MDLLRVAAVLLLAGAGLAPAASAACAGPMLFCDDFATDQGWTSSGTGTSQAATATGWSFNPATGTFTYNANSAWAYNPNDWHDSNQGCGDTHSKYVGVQAAGQDVGYLSPQPFGYWQGNTMAPLPLQNFLPWYEVENDLVSPEIDATGVPVTTIGYSVRGSSEDTSGVAYDTLIAKVRVAGGSTYVLGTYSSKAFQAACNAFTFNAPYLSNTKFQFVFTFRQDSNTDSTYLAPCSPQACPSLGTPVCVPGMGTMCLDGGMGWYVDDVFVRRAAVRPLPIPQPDLVLCPVPAVVDFHLTDYLAPPYTDIDSLLWAFGDSATASGPDATHAYLYAGTYAASLTATLNDGSAVSSGRTIRVQETCDAGQGGQALPKVEPQMLRPGVADPRDGVDARVAGQDLDKDGVPDRDDSCPLKEGPQGDLDLDGLGDVCDPDQDGDGILDGADLCPLLARSQLDLDGNGVGDGCEKGRPKPALPGPEPQAPAAAPKGSGATAPAVKSAAARHVAGVPLPAQAVGALWLPLLAAALVAVGAAWFAVRRSRQE